MKGSFMDYIDKNAICAIIVTYFPDNLFSKRLNLILSQVNHIIIVDNSADPNTTDLLKTLEGEKVVVLYNENNLGVATALNQGCQWALSHGYRWTLTFDQDTEVELNMVNTLSKIFNSYDDKEKIALIGSNSCDIHSGELMIKTKKTPHESWIEVKTAITSGSLMSLQVYNDIGPFRDEFFIDCVDNEYCLRARANGYMILSTIEPTIKHPIGQATIHNFFGFHVATPNHPAFRRYYITRNRLILVFEYLFKEPVWAIDRFYHLIALFGVICLFEKHRLKKLRYILLGIFDALRFSTKRIIRTSQDRN